MMQIFRAHDLDDFPTVTCDDMRVLVELAETTQMIALLPQLVIDELKGNHRLAVLSVAAPFSEAFQNWMVKAIPRMDGFKQYAVYVEYVPIRVVAVGESQRRRGLQTEIQD